MRWKLTIFQNTIGADNILPRKTYCPRKVAPSLIIMVKYRLFIFLTLDVTTMKSPRLERNATLAHILCDCDMKTRQLCLFKTGFGF